MTRADGRRADELRPLRLEANWLEQPHGSLLYSQGKTKVLCTASIEEGVPRWLLGKGRGWMTAEYSLLPASTGERTDREATRGKQGGRTVEIQRLIGRSLRAVADFRALGERTLHLDCDVLQADGGTRTASISGAYVAARRAPGPPPRPTAARAPRRSPARPARRAARSTASASRRRCRARSPRCPSGSSTASRCSTSTTWRTRAPTPTSTSS